MTPLSSYLSQLFSSRRTVGTPLCLGFHIFGNRRIDIDQVWVANSLLLVPASAKSKITLGDRSFKAAAPKLWNKLPSDLRNLSNLSAFKSQLKTYLFRLAFDL